MVDIISCLITSYLGEEAHPPTLVQVVVGCDKVSPERTDLNINTMGKNKVMRKKKKKTFLKKISKVIEYATYCQLISVEIIFESFLLMSIIHTHTTSEEIFDKSEMLITVCPINLLYYLFEIGVFFLKFSYS